MDKNALKMRSGFTKLLSKEAIFLYILSVVLYFVFGFLITRIKKSKDFKKKLIFTFAILVAGGVFYYLYLYLIRGLID